MIHKVAVLTHAFQWCKRQVVKLSRGSYVKLVAVTLAVALLVVVLGLSLVPTGARGLVAESWARATRSVPGSGTNVIGRRAASPTGAKLAAPTHAVSESTSGATPTASTASHVSVSPPTPSPSQGGSGAFDDEFDGSSLDTTQWMALNRPGDSSNSELECYLPSNVRESGGYLTLTGQVDSSCAGYSYTSGMVQMSAYSFLYGRVDIRAKMPSGQGVWPALWLLGSNCQSTNPSTPDNTGACQWPTPGSDEVDILELKGQDPTTDYMTTVYGSVPNQPYYPQCTYTGPDFSQDFHTFSLDWTPGQLTWFVDGVQRCVQTVGVPSHPMFLILNVALGGGFVGSVDNSALPQTLTIDYVHVVPAALK